MGLGQFGDSRLDKGGLRFSNGLCTPVAFASVAWLAVHAAGKCAFTAFWPIPK